MLHPELVEGDRPIPPEGAIDEAVETAKAFCGAEAPGFVNGILAAALRERRGAGTVRPVRPPALTNAPAMPPESLERLIERLEHAAATLRAGELDADRAAALVEECARSPPRRAPSWIGRSARRERRGQLALALARAA